MGLMYMEDIQSEGYKENTLYKSYKIYISMKNLKKVKLI